MRRFAQLALARGGLLGVATLVLYVWVAPQHVVDGDNAEFATLGAIGGRAHPSGYPLYVLWLRATSWLPGASAAHTSAIATAILSAALVVVLYHACRAWGARPIASTLAAVIFATSPVVLRMHTEAEVFALNGLVVATVIWLAAAAGPLRGTWRAVVLALVAGLGMANHMTCVLIAPVGLLGVVRGLRETGTAKPLAGVLAIGAFVLGLAPYGYLVVAEGPASFGTVDTAGDLLDFILRRFYGGPGAFIPQGQAVAASTSIGALVATVGRAWLYVPGVIGVVALGILAVRRRPDADESVWGWRMLAASLVLAGPLLASRFNIDPRGLGLYVCQRFHLLPMLMLAIPVAVGLDRIAVWVKDRTGSELLASSRAGFGLAVVAFVALAVLSLPGVKASHSPAMQLGVKNLLLSVPPNAVVLTLEEDQCFGAAYLQRVENVRPDVDFVCTAIANRDWYRARFAGRVPLAPTAVMQASAQQAEAILATGRPLLVDRWQGEILARLPTYPSGILIRVLPRGTRVPPIAEVVELNRTIYQAFDLDYERPSSDDDYAALAHQRYARTWVTISTALEASGDREGAAQAIELARQLAPHIAN